METNIQIGFIICEWRIIKSYPSDCDVDKKTDFNVLERQKMKLNLKKILYIGSFFTIIIISVYTNIKNNASLISSILITILLAIPAIYSLIPLLNELKMKSYNRKNILSNDLFTDRVEDIQHILEMLCSHDHIIEIRGKETNCGKTWLAKYLCDCINNPKINSSSKKKINHLYAQAYYRDLKNFSEEDIHDFFSSNLINSKTVLVFDNVNVSDLDIIIAKQKIYHFQLVYIMMDMKDINRTAHYVSAFGVENMDKLHKKIRNNYPNLDELSFKEFNTLYELTNGNIGQISGILSEQKCIDWLKDIAAGVETEYDKILNSIQIDLFIGHYEKAKEKLDEFKIQHGTKINNISDLYYKYYLMLSDCEHLLNNYDDALDTLVLVGNKIYNKYNTNYQVELHRAHYLKHLWRSNDALDILYPLMNTSYSAIVDSLGILAAKYFIADMHVGFSEKNALEVYEDMYVRAENSDLKHNQNDTYKLLRHKPIYYYYTQKPATNEELIGFINDIIAKYQAENNRLLANAYFVKGEIYRIYHQYNEAVMEYKKCFAVTKDNNILIQVNLMVYYLKNVKKFDLDFEVLSIEKIIYLCENNEYAKKVYNRVNSIQLADPHCEEIMHCIDTRIMPIL